jgi:hypothetical protein
MGSIRLADQNIAALIELRTQRTWQPCGLRECSKHPFPNSVKHPGAFVGQIVNLRRIVNPLPPRQQL